MLAFDDRKSSNAGANKDARTFGQLGTDRQSRLFHCTVGSGYGVVNERVHLLDVFFLEPAEGIELFNFACNLGGKLSGVETGNLGNAATPFAKAVPRILGSRPERGYQTHARHHNSSFLQNKNLLSLLTTWACE